MIKKKTAKKQEVKKKVVETKLELSLLCCLLCVCMNDARSADLGAGYSQTSTGSVQKNYNLAFGVTDRLSVALYSANSLQKSDDTSVDNKAASYKGSLIYRPDSSLRFAAAYKKIDDYNEYKGVSYSGKISVKSNPPSSNYFGSTKFTLGVQDDEMKYTKDQSEQYEKLVLSLGLSQVIAEHFTIGVDWSKNAYLVTGTSTIAAFKNKTITDVNISDTVDALSDSSRGAYIEYNDLTFWSLGIGYSESKDLQEKKDITKSYESYADIEIGENVTVSPSYTMTKSKTSSTPKVNSVALNITINF